MRVEEESSIQYDWFIDTDPEVIERVKQAEKRGEAEGLAKGEERGEAKGEVQALRRTALRVVEKRFPALLAFAQVQVNALKQPAHLEQLILDLMQAPDDVTVIRLLTLPKQPV